MPVSRKYLLLAGGAIAAVAVGAYFFLRSRKTAKVDAEYEEDEEVIVEETTTTAPEAKRAAAPAPSAGAAAGSGAPMRVETLRALLGDMHRQTQALLVTIAQHQQVQEQSGRGVDAEELIHLFNTHAAELRNQLFIKYGGINEEDLDAAIEAHQEDMQVVQLTMMLNQLYSAVRQNQELPDVPADMTVDKFLGKLQIFVRAVVDNLDTAIKEAQREGVRGEDLQEKVSHLVMLRAKKAQEDAFSEMAMSDALFQACLKAYQSDPRVQAVFADLHDRNTRKLEALTMG